MTHLHCSCDECCGNLRLGGTDHAVALCTNPRCHTEQRHNVLQVFRNLRHTKGLWTCHKIGDDDFLRCQSRRTFSAMSSIWYTCTLAVRGIMFTNPRSSISRKCVHTIVRGHPPRATPDLSCSVASRRVKWLIVAASSAIPSGCPHVSAQQQATNLHACAPKRTASCGSLALVCWVSHRCTSTAAPSGVRTNSSMSKSDLLELCFSIWAICRASIVNVLCGTDTLHQASEPLLPHSPSQTHDSCADILVKILSTSPTTAASAGP